MNIIDRNNYSIKSLFKDIRKYKILTNQELPELIKEAKKGDTNARDILVNSNMRYIISVASPYKSMGIPLEDLISEGTLGFLEAIKKYKLSGGMTFLNYATIWIKQYILNHITDASRTIRASSQQIYNYTRINKFIANFKKEHNRTPSNEEIGEALKLSPKNVIRAQVASQFQLSLDRSIDYDDDSGDSFLSFTVDTSESIESEIFKEERRKEVWKYVDKLPEREAFIISQYFGRDGYPQTLDNIGEELNLNKERARQLLKQGLKTLRTRYKEKLQQLL